MTLVNHGKDDFEKINNTIRDFLNKTAAERPAVATRLYIVHPKFSSRIRVLLIVGSGQNDQNMIWYYFHLENDLDNRRIDFEFCTADILAVWQEENDFFILLKN